jgi:hypothetical protein
MVVSVALVGEGKAQRKSDDLYSEKASSPKGGGWLHIFRLSFTLKLVVQNFENTNSSVDVRCMTSFIADQVGIVSYRHGN